MKSLDTKLAKIRAGKYRPADFIIADAGDGDMGAGTWFTGQKRGGTRLKSKAEFLAELSAISRSGLIDILLCSVSTAEILTAEKLFAKSAITPAVRLNDTTDIWSQRGSGYKQQPSQPYRSVNVQRARKFSDLGLYSVTYTNDVKQDLKLLEAFAAFREDALKARMRYFLEVFNPVQDIGLKGHGLGTYINDCITRTLAGLAQAEQPLFLKMQYNGPQVMEELAGFDPKRLIVGILGGGRGTTRDCFELATQAERHGARVALFGRKINLAEDPIELVRLMRRAIEGAIKPDDAVKAYHAHLAKRGLTPDLGLADDLAITDPALKG